MLYDNFQDPKNVIQQLALIYKLNYVWAPINIFWNNYNSFTNQINIIKNTFNNFQFLKQWFCNLIAFLLTFAKLIIHSSILFDFMITFFCNTVSILFNFSITLICNTVSIFFLGFQYQRVYLPQSPTLWDCVITFLTKRKDNLNRYEIIVQS